MSKLIYICLSFLFFLMTKANATTSFYCENSKTEKLYIYLDSTSFQMSLTQKLIAKEIAKVLPEKRHRFPFPESSQLMAKVSNCMFLQNQLTCQVMGDDYWEVFNSIGKLSARGAGLPAIIEFNQKTAVFRLSTQNLNQEIQFKNTCRISFVE